MLGSYLIILILQIVEPVEPTPVASTVEDDLNLKELQVLEPFLLKRNSLLEENRKRLSKTNEQWFKFRIELSSEEFQVPKTIKTKIAASEKKKNEFKLNNDFTQLSEMVFSTASKIDNPDPYILDNAFKPAYKFKLDPSWIKPRPLPKYN